MQAAPTDGRIIFARVGAMPAINRQQVRQLRHRDERKIAVRLQS
jgi:hypothetical protein